MLRLFCIIKESGNMQNKVWQITDSIHGTIYISELEHLMMSTPFFTDCMMCTKALLYI